MVEELSAEQWLQGLRAIRQTYESQYINAVVDKEVVASADGLSAEQEAVYDNLIATNKRRLDEIDERIGASKDGAQGLNRAERRRLEKAATKEKA